MRDMIARDLFMINKETREYTRTKLNFEDYSVIL